MTTALLLGWLTACTSSGSEPEVDSSVAKQPEAPQSSKAAPTRTDGPCTTDADCLAYVNCDCGCEPRLASIPFAQGEAWMTMCNGHPPPNCGVASPCGTFVASCDNKTSSCVVRAK